MPEGSNRNDQEDGGYTFSYEHDGETVVMSDGGISLSDNGGETWLSPAYLAITREGNGSCPFSHTNQLSDEEKELYSCVTTESYCCI